jgi:hypothetical protein
VLSLSEIISITLDIILIFVSASAILIILYDRIKDSINLRRQVKTFYENIEKLIFYYYERAYYMDFPNKNEDQEDIFKHNHLKWYYYESYIKTKFDKYGEFLGLIHVEKRSYTNETIIHIDQTGSIKANLKHFKEGNEIEKELIEYINDFLTNCVKFWNSHYKSLVKRKITKNFDFRNLKGFKEPHTPEHEPATLL